LTAEFAKKIAKLAKKKARLGHYPTRNALFSFAAKAAWKVPLYAALKRRSSTAAKASIFHGG
jgi:hypothetical protein